jgi:hypothetical protein
MVWFGGKVGREGGGGGGALFKSRGHFFVKSVKIEIDPSASDQ